jgi:hypothetical protein
VIATPTSNELNEDLYEKDLFNARMAVCRSRGGRASGRWHCTFGFCSLDLFSAVFAPKSSPQRSDPERLAITAPFCLTSPFAKRSGDHSYF